MLILLSLLFIVLPNQVLGQDSGWAIEKFHSDISIQPNGKVRVIENIDVDFGFLSKHGIYRDIPYRYQKREGGKHYTTVNNVSVLQNNNIAAFTLNRVGDFLRIKIGEADITISGKQRYVISYILEGVLIPYDSYDEFYWNVTGNSWQVPINKASSTVSLPTNEILQIACYKGSYESNEKCEEKNIIGNNSIFSTSKLNESEGLTIAVGYKKGLVPILTVDTPKSFGERLFEIPTIFTFLASFIGGVLIILIIWYKRGRDFWYAIPQILGFRATQHIKPVGAKESIVVEYEPPDKLPPALLGTLMDEKADTLDVSATFIDLATRGYLKIIEIPKKWLFGSTDFEFKKTSKDIKQLISYEQLLLNCLFEDSDCVKMSELKNTFYDELVKVKKALYKEVTNKKLFVENPGSVRNLYIIASIVILIGSSIAFFSGIANEIPFLTALGAGFILSGLSVFLMSSLMPRRTANGRDLYRRAKGYRLFISGAEKYKQQFFERRNMFNEILPYAIIFGLTEKFAQAMHDMGIKPDTTGWYYGTSHFNVATFGSNINAFSSSLSSSIASTPSRSGSGGGGSSGGGFGGGGGGSW